MQRIDHVVDVVALYIAQRKESPGKFWFSKIDLKYAYSQIPLDNSVAKHCNFVSSAEKQPDYIDF